MKGWFCIYECSEGKWLMSNQWWSMDLAVHAEHLPTKWDVVLTTITGPDWSTKPDIQLRAIDYRNIVIADTDHETNPYNILRFETLQQAENHLLTAGFHTGDGKYYTIRKIYF